MCRKGLGWDDPLTDELKPKWEAWKSDLVNLEKVEMPHFCKPDSFGKTSRTEFHYFSDASNQGYGQCSYVRFRNNEGKVHCTFP